MSCHSILTVQKINYQEWDLEGHKERVLATVFTAEADGLISTAHDGTLIVWQ